MHEERLMSNLAGDRKTNPTKPDRRPLQPREKHQSCSTSQEADCPNVNDEERWVVRENSDRISCAICGTKMHKKSLKRHERCKHGAHKPYAAICCDPKEGIYMVKWSAHGGIGFPLQVQKTVNSNEGNRMECENQSCRDLMIMAARSEMTGRECVHLMQVNNAFFPVQVELDQRKLKELPETEKYKVLTEETVVDCIKKNSAAIFHDSPLVVEWDDVNFIHLSIFDGKYMNFPALSRYVVTYQKETGQLDCRCHPSKYFCIHKSIALWYLYQKGLP